MEAFQLSLGRKADFNLANITFTDQSANDRQRALHQRRAPMTTSPEPAISVIPTPAPTSSRHCRRPAGREPQLQHQYRGQGSSCAQRQPGRPGPELSVRWRLRKDATESESETASSATSRSTRRPWWKRQTPRRSFTTTSSVTLKDAVAFYSGAEFNAVAGSCRIRLQRHAERPDRRLPARHQHASEHRRRPARAPGNPRQPKQPAQRTRQTFADGVRRDARRD